MVISSQVAVTGVTGFVGSALACRLREAGCSVRGLVRGTSAPDTVAFLRDLGVTLVEGDVTEPDSLAALVDGADLVVHSAAVIGYRRRLWGQMAHVNVIGTRHVVDACRAADVGRLVHVSSIAAVGITDQPELQDESSPWTGGRLDAAYFDTKREAELELGSGLHHGLDAVIVNPGAIYGPSVARSNSSNVIASIVRRRPRLVPTGGINVVPLDTVVEGVLCAAERGKRGRRYILGGENLHYAELVQRVGRAAGLTLRPRSFPGSLGRPARLVMDVLEPLVPDRYWYTPDMCAAFGRWMWFDTRLAAQELGLTSSPLDACLEATVAQLRADGRLAAR